MNFFFSRNQVHENRLCTDSSNIADKNLSVLNLILLFLQCFLSSKIFTHNKSKGENLLRPALQIYTLKLRKVYVLNVFKVFNNGPSKICLGRPYHFKPFKGYLLQIFPGPFLNTLTLVKLLWLMKTSMITSVFPQSTSKGRLLIVC